MLNVYFEKILSIAIIAFLLFMILNHLYRRYYLEGFETEPPASEEPKVSEQTVPEPKVSEQTVPEQTVPEPKVSEQTVPEPKVSEQTVPEQTPISTDSETDTDKATTMADLFEKVNKQMDMIRTLKLSEKLVPVNIDKKVPEHSIILANLKLLINNGVNKNELDLKEIYDKYIGNKAIALLTSDINSVDLEQPHEDLEATFLSRTKAVVDGHQKIIDKILENKSKE
jgi:hypothetical protein